MEKYTWVRRNGYECSSVGDKRFSALYARMSDGESIEYHYQVNVKGYNSIRDGKGKPPLNEITKDELWKRYLSLWIQWAKLNQPLINDLREKVKEKNNVLSDCFANSEISQARALAYILNHYERYFDSDITKVIIAGCRDFHYQKHGKDYWFNEFDKYLEGLGIDLKKVQIVSGGAKGADTFGELYASERGMELKRFIPDWETIPEGESFKINRQGKKYYPLAGHVRNKAMGDYSDVLIALWDKKSSGTRNMIMHMRRLHKEHKVFVF